MTKEFKIAHISDCHLGYRSGQFRDNETGINLREQDGYDALDKAIDEIIEAKLDVVICSGDMFHSPKPSIYTIIQCKKILQKLVKAGIPFYNIAGNHDAEDSIREIPANAVIDEPLLGLYSYTEPYVVVEISPGIVCHFVSHHGFIAQQETMKRLKTIKGKFNILVTHGSVYDTNMNMILHSESEPREIVIPEEIMNMDWDYTLMGHIHERGWVSSTDGLTDTSNRKQFYGGSLIRRGFSDKECKLGRGWTMWTIKDQKEMTPEFHIIEERLQKDIIIQCKNRSTLEIENKIASEFEKIDFSQTPILRVTLVNISKQNKTALDMSKFREDIQKCLTFGMKYKMTEEVEATEAQRSSFSYDLHSAYRAFWEIDKENYTEDVQEPINKESVSLLNKGQEKIIK